MSFVIEKAVREQCKLRLGLCGPSGSGKTYSALLIAMGLGGKIGLIDTERRSASLYASVCDFDVINLTPPYSPERYMEAMRAFEDAGYSTIILDTISHAWAGEGGLLERVDAAKAGGGNSNNFAAWRSATPVHNRFIDAMLKTPCHLIATMRAKTEYVLEEDSRGKKVPRKVGMAPIQRDGMEYEFTMVLDLDLSNTASASKTRVSEFKNVVFQPTVDTGRQLSKWLEAGVVPAARPAEGAGGGNAVGADPFLQEWLDGVKAADDLPSLQKRFAKAWNTYRENTEAQMRIKEVYEARKAALGASGQTHQKAA